MSDASALCPTCFCNPCVAICPEVDPYWGRGQEEHDDYVAGCDPYEGWGDPDLMDDDYEGQSHEDYRPHYRPVAGMEVAPPVEGTEDDIPF